MNYLEWVKANPLRVWRTEQGISAMQAAAMIGVSEYAVKAWERGASHPSQDNLASIARVIGTDNRTFWSEWLQEQPAA